jgi:hypothetical protein
MRGGILIIVPIILIAIAVLFVDEKKRVSPSFFRLGAHDPFFVALYRKDGTMRRFAKSVIVTYLLAAAALIWWYIGF